MIKIHRILLGALPLAALAALAPCAQAQVQSAPPSIGLSVLGEGVFLSSNSTTFQGGGTSAKFKSIDGGGAEVSYAINSQFTANLDLWTASADLSGGGATVDTTATTETVGMDYLTPKVGIVTPYLGVDLGSIHYSGSGVSESDFIYGGHVGVRCDFDQHWFGKVAVQLYGTQLKDSNGSMLFTGGVVGVGYRF